MILKKETTSILESIKNKKRVDEEYDVTEVPIEQAIDAPDEVVEVATPDFASAMKDMRNKKIQLKNNMKPAIAAVKELEKDTERDGIKLAKDADLKAMHLSEDLLEEEATDMKSVLDKRVKQLAALDKKDDKTENLKEDADAGDKLTLENVKKWLTVGYPGATINVATKEAVAYKDGYEISLENTEETVDYAEVGENFDITDEVVAKVHEKLTRKIDNLTKKKGSNLENTCVGIWGDDESHKVYLDESEYFNGTEAEAVKIGRERNQLSVWDWKNGESVETGIRAEREKEEPKKEDEKETETETTESEGKLVTERDYPVSKTLAFHVNDLDKVKEIVEKSEFKELIEIDEVPNKYGICFITIDTRGLGAEELDKVDKFLAYVKSSITVNETLDSKEVEVQRSEIKKDNGLKQRGHMLRRKTRVEESTKEVNEEKKKSTKKSALYLFEPKEEVEKIWNFIKNEDKIEALDFILEDMYPEGISEDVLNELLVTNSDWILGVLGLGEYFGGDFDEE